MLNIFVSVDDKAAVQDLGRIRVEFPGAIEGALEKLAIEVERGAFDRLSGSGSEYPGGYPVPVRMGHLRRSLDFLKPGATKSKDGKSFSVGPMEAMVFDAADYAMVIHEGWGSSKKFYPRPYITDALEKLDQGGAVVKAFDEALEGVIK